MAPEKKKRRYNQSSDVAFEQAAATAPAEAAANDEIIDDDDSDDDDSVSGLEVEAEAVSNDGPDHGYIVDEWLNNGQKVWKIKCRSSLLQMNALPFDRNTEKYDFSGTYEYKGKKFRIEQYDPIRLMVHKHKPFIHYMMHRCIEKNNNGRGRFKLITGT